MKIIIDIDPCDFDAWEGGKDTLDEINKFGDKDKFNKYVEDTFPDPIDDTDFNDWLWTSRDEIYSDLNINSGEIELPTQETITAFLLDKLGTSNIKSNGKTVDLKDLLDDISDYAHDNDFTTWYYDKNGNKVEQTSDDLLNAWWDENSDDIE